MNFNQYNLLRQNNDDDIDPNEDCAIEADAFSQKAIPIIIKDDLEQFIDLVSSPEFNWDGNFPHARERMYLSNYLYQPFFDLLTGPTALCFAAFFNAEKIVDFILGLPDVDKSDAFHFACAGGSFNVMRTLFEQSQCDLVNKDQLRPLNIASYFGNVDVVKYLWTHGCPIISPEDTYSSVNKAAFNGNINVLEFFKEVDPTLLTKMKGYKHPIISAAIGGQPKCVEYFIKLGDINKVTITSALLEACRKGSLSCVKILVSAYKDYKPPVKNSESKKKVTKKNTKRGKKKDTKEYLPSKKRGRRNKNKDVDDSDQNEYESEEVEEEDFDEDKRREFELENDKELPLNIFTMAIKKCHIDVLRYLLSVSQISSIDKLLSCAIKQINLKELENQIISYNYFPFSFHCRKTEEKEATKKKWIIKTIPIVNIAKFLFQRLYSNDFIKSLFEVFLEDGNINDAVYFLDQINFKIIEKNILSDAQLEFFKCAILQSNPITIPFLKKMINNQNIDFFEINEYEKIRDKAIASANQPSQRKKKKDADFNDDEYQEELRLMNNFMDYLHILTERRGRFSTETALFLIEMNFPYFILVDKKVKNIKSYEFTFPFFFDACLKVGKYDYAEKFMVRQMPMRMVQGLETLFEIGKKLFDKNENEEISQNDPSPDSSFNGDNNALKIIYEFNKKCEEDKTKEDEDQNENENKVENKFNIFKYQCKNEDEMKIYNQIMSMIKQIIKLTSTQPQVALLLCDNGLDNEWIIEQMKDDNMDEILIDDVEDNNGGRHAAFYTFYRNQPPHKKGAPSINPLINLATYFNSSSWEILKYYFNRGINMPSGTIYEELFWKYLIDYKKGHFVYILIKYGNPDKELRLLDNSICLFDYAIEAKAVNIIYLFLNFNFYSEDSLAKNPNSLINKLNKEKAKSDKKHDVSEIRKKNLKIIALIYKYLKDDYDLKLRKKLTSELKSRMKPI